MELENVCSDLKDLHVDKSVDALQKGESSQQTDNNWFLPQEDFFMSVCNLTAARSKDPVTKVGACIIDKDNKIVSVGYNGMPLGISDCDLPWTKNNQTMYMNKYPYVCHAEMNAIMNGKRNDFKNCTIFVNKFPCSDCAKMIIQAGVKHVVYSQKKPEPPEVFIPASKMFSLAKVTFREFVPTVREIEITMGGHDAGITCINIDK
ncbi:deoxycytidylate deaminase-like [Uloborus diversus]|uniref:deoxycytidylate deaminase-like n=1 Tax=Uloborus diversus TaxID=327109 RepID=UPI00240A7726|nr:deoxycytidylate deaminase-like [Uloborus diversus]